MPRSTEPPNPRHAGGSPPSRVDDYYLGVFAAMASPCQVLVDTDDPAEAEAVLRVAQDEALRIERKFSRYRDDNIVHRINHSGGEPVTVDEETALLLDYGATCHEVSEGMFDLTSGVLRRVWTFDGGDRVPSREAVREVLGLVGWDRVRWEGSALTLPPRMEIDFGGIGKEYAVDRAAGLVAARTARPFLVNFGGDLFASGERRGGRPWGIGVDDPSRTGEGMLLRIDLVRGGIATTGDARRYVMWRGRRLSHILDPRTGWPVVEAPQAVTVLAGTCLEAGTLSTLAYLRGPGARAFLEEQGVRFWVV
jgi:thiamine biosynthesis lipoprotein